MKNKPESQTRDHTTRAPGSTARKPSGRQEHLSSAAVVRDHWPAVYAALRAAGRSSASSIDIARRFIGEAAVNHRLLMPNGEPPKRARSAGAEATVRFLETCRSTEGPEFVSHYAATPGLMEAAAGEAMCPHGCDDPALAFGIAWGASIVHAALAQVRGRCIRLKMEPNWVAFERRVVRPLLTDQPPSSYAKMKSILPKCHTAEMMLSVATIKRWFAHAVNVEVHRTVLQRDSAMGELRTLATMQELAPPAKRHWSLAQPFFWAMQLADEPAPALADWLLAEAFGDNRRYDQFLTNPRTSIDMLEQSKFVFKAMRTNGERTEDRQLGRAAYLGAIAAGLAHHGKLMSEQSVAALAEAFEKMLDDNTVPKSMQILAGQGLCQLKTGIQEPTSFD